MSILNRKEAIILGLGDIFLFQAALLITLVLRYGVKLENGILYAHFIPFSILIVVWICIFFIAGLYEKHTLLVRSRVPNVLFKVTIINSFIAVIFFYFIPYFGIAPKINLFIYLLIASVGIFAWRKYGQRFFYSKKRQNAISIGTGNELDELSKEVNQNQRYDMRFIESIEISKLNVLDFRQKFLNRIEADGVSLVAVDFKNPNVQPIIKDLYGLIFKKIQFIDIHKLYEEIFDRIPLSLITYDWFLENVSATKSIRYDSVKRIMDVVISLVLFFIPLIIYPFVFLAMKIEDGGPVLISQKRVGKDNKDLKLLKFRTMLFNDNGDWKIKGKENRVTKVGMFLRKTRLDEFPQLWNVLKGDISLIGPRPEFHDPVRDYGEQIPYYNTRHLIKPGLSGWAQLYHDNHPHHQTNIGETRIKLSYDLYYIKNRSLILDLKIALKTVKTLLSRSGV